MVTFCVVALAVSLVVNVVQARTVARLRVALERFEGRLSQASKNDARDPKTGRFVKA